LPIDSIQNSAFYGWLTQNPEWIAVSILTIAFVESFAIIGVVVPGVFLLYVAAFMAGSGLLDIQSSLLMAFCGAVLGDGCSYFLGRYFKRGVRTWPLIRDNLHWMDTGELFIERHGMKSIVLARFLGPIRPIMPMVAGSLSMPAQRFFAVNALSAIAWAPVYVMPGFALGAAMDMPFSSTEMTIVVLLGLALLGGAFFLVRRWFDADQA